MAQNQIKENLHLENGQRLLVLNPPDEHSDVLRRLPDDVNVDTDADRSYDAVLLFLETRNDLYRHVNAARDATGSEGNLWIAYPKTSGQLEEEIVKNLGLKTSDDERWRNAARFDLDDRWTAIRFSE